MDRSGHDTQNSILLGMLQARVAVYMHGVRQCDDSPHVSNGGGDAALFKHLGRRERVVCESAVAHERHVLAAPPDYALPNLRTGTTTLTLINMLQLYECWVCSTIAPLAALPGTMHM